MGPRPEDNARSRTSSQNSETLPLIQTPKAIRQDPINQGPKFDRASLKARWVILFLCSVALTGNYYCYDNPSALKAQLHDYFESTPAAKNWETNFALLYSVYSFPNTILPFVGGYLVDRVGVRPMTIIFCGFITAGQCLFAFGTSLKSIPVMLAGRVVFGFGGESLTVASSAILSYWFKDKELALALGINLGVSRLGGVANNFVSPILWKHGRVSIWFGAILCGVSMGSALLMIFMDKVAETKLKRLNTEYTDAEEEVEVEQIKLSDVQYFGRPFWLLTTSCLVVYGTVLPFNNIASTFLQTRDFMPASEPWDKNISFIAPICSGNKPSTNSDSLMTTRACGVINTYLGPSFMGADFSAIPGLVTGNVTTGVNYTVGCAGGYKPANASKTTTVKCMDTGDDDEWEGDAYWTVTAGAGCVAATCNASDLVAATYIHAVPAAKAGHYGCAEGYCLRDAKVPGCLTSDLDLTFLLECKNDLVRIKPRTEKASTIDLQCVPLLSSPKKYCSDLDKAESTANAFMSIPYFISIMISPLLGYSVDRLGKRAVLATGASVALMGVHATLGLSRVAPYGPLVGQGLAYSIFAAALWPSVPYAVEEQYVGTAYGVMTAVQNTGLATFPLAVSALLTSCTNNPPKKLDQVLSQSEFTNCSNSINAYEYSELFFVGLAAFGTLIGVWLYLDDIWYRDGVLNKSHMKEEELSADDLAVADKLDSSNIQ